MAELYLVEFKGSRREYFYNTYYHTLKLADYVIIQAEQGEDMGVLSKKINPDFELPASIKPRSILRPAGRDDITLWGTLRENETVYRSEFTRLARKHDLLMKIVDVECQFDGSKITFYFTADHRVDFRALVRDLAARYRTRIELRQIGVRDEARRLDGMGVCGRRQCCNCFIRDFAPISTQHAREQDLSLNPSKISGNCGRLLCCLRYETEQYASVKRFFPVPGTRVRTSKGTGILEKIDIFAEEAVITGEEGVHFRVSAGDILASGEERPGVSRLQLAERPVTDKDFDVTEQDEEALRRLDEPDA